MPSCTGGLRGRSEDLERLSVPRIIAQHEEEWRRLILELHGAELAEVFRRCSCDSAFKGRTPAAHTARLEQDHRSGGCRDVQHSERDRSAAAESLLDDLGLIPALRALVSDFGGRSGLEYPVHRTGHAAGSRKDAELALFRAVQEGLANVARHAKAKSVEVT